MTAITGGRPITGYQIFLWLLLLAFLHAPLLHVRFSWTLESQAWAAFLLLSVVWDYLWFVLNPHFGLSRFDAAHVWWYARWGLGVPTDYYVGLPASLIVFLLPGHRPAELITRVREWGVIAGTTLGCTAYEIGTFGTSDAVIVLFDERDGELRYVKGDDDSGEDRNARLKVKLTMGRRYVLRVRLYYSDRAGETAVMMW